jgi:hypothetical protein
MAKRLLTALGFLWGFSPVGAGDTPSIGSVQARTVAEHQMKQRTSSLA